MVPGSPPAPHACSTCFTPLPPGTDRCPRCGTLAGDFRRCEMCGARAEVIRKDQFLFVCAACGKPRVPMDQPGVMRSGRERSVLQKAGEARRDAAVSQVGGIVASGITGFFVLFALFALWLSWTGFATL